MSLISFPADRPLDLIALGRLCIDMNANEINRPMEETLTFTKYLGGSPANIAIAAARLGVRTGFVGKVADDQFGRFIRQYLTKEGINTDNVVTDRTGSVTGLAFTEIRSPQDCSILMYRDNAADLKLAPGEVKEDYIKQAKALLISGTALAKSPSREAVFMALEYAVKHGVRVIFDVDYRPYSWNSLEETGIYCRMVAEKSDVIIAGREEFDLMEAPFGELRHDDWYTAEMWFRCKARLVLVKHGSKGSIAFTKDGKTYRAGTFPANVVKTFGAGDSFAGAFIYGLFQGWSVDRCQQFGSASASIVVSSHSCSDAMPTVEQIEAVIAQHSGRNDL
ncbi:5-dehydro-2-deoxygluconokinase [Gordoniibacillus kamchatkensis]|uniref:5-dehydro-2-deoxygluconokinase n=1 Tax=Gordoniibacillus kamchatkensis TaxID=1590651 RepID=A0ABR5AIP0_9BACL|nr:5-dehydro-2-deoxygluconokinase [Paenibacillus sp. VKM B-2647]KIL40901.1 5-dehydro-2-deoxygluconokinase [Paenibacillus sp. VKM B-2647]